MNKILQKLIPITKYEAHNNDNAISIIPVVKIQRFDSSKSRNK